MWVGNAQKASLVPDAVRRRRAVATTASGRSRSARSAWAGRGRSRWRLGWFWRFGWRLRWLRRFTRRCRWLPTVWHTDSFPKNSSASSNIVCVRNPRPNERQRLDNDEDGPGSAQGKPYSCSKVKAPTEVGHWHWPKTALSGRLTHDLKASPPLTTPLETGFPERLLWLLLGPLSIRCRSGSGRVATLAEVNGFAAVRVGANATPGAAVFDASPRAGPRAPRLSRALKFGPGVG